MSTETTTTVSGNPTWMNQRLELLERALLGVVPREERLERVAELEARFQTLLEKEPTLGNAAPEQEVALGSNGNVSYSAESSATRTQVLASRGGRKRSRLALSAGVMGIASLILLLTSPVLYTMFALFAQSMEFVAITLIIGLVLSIAGLGLSAVVFGIVSLVKVARSQGKMTGRGWAITGICTGPMPMLAGAAGTLMFVLPIGLEMLQATATVPPTNVSYAVPVAGDGQYYASNNAYAVPALTPGTIAPAACYPVTNSPERCPTCPLLPASAPAPASNSPYSAPIAMPASIPAPVSNAAPIDNSHLETPPDLTAPVAVAPDAVTPPNN